MSPDAKLPDKIGRYPVERLLGRGAMGSVYLARDTELDRDVAIKTVRMPGSPDEQESFLVRFRNEARAVGRLRHRSIVGVYDVGNDAQFGPYLVFEYVEGPTLKEMLRSKGPLTPEQVVALAEQVGGALDAAHREGIIHRDIKPENLLVGKDGVVRLADFGVARVPDAALTGEGQFLGTPCYGAPETLRSGTSGPSSDQFSFAAVLYEAATGSRAFPGSDALAVAHSVIHDEPPAPSRVAVPYSPTPQALDAVILRGLSKDPTARYEQLSSFVSEVRRAYGVKPQGAGDVADTVPALLARNSSISSAPTARRRALPLWPFAVLLVLGVVAVIQLAPSAPEVTTSPASASDDAARPVPPTPSNQRPPPHNTTTLPPVEPSVRDAGGEVAVRDAGAALPNPATLSGFEREERAKDALERAERALTAGDKEGARKALDEAFHFDPEHPDIPALRRRL